MSSPIRQNKPAKQATEAVDQNILSPATGAGSSLGLPTQGSARCARFTLG